MIASSGDSGKRAPGVRGGWHSVKGETLRYQWLELAGRSQNPSEAARLAFLHPGCADGRRATTVRARSAGPSTRRCQRGTASPAPAATRVRWRVTACAWRRPRRLRPGGLGFFAGPASSQTNRIAASYAAGRSPHQGYALVRKLLTDKSRSRPASPGTMIRAAAILATQRLDADRRLTQADPPGRRAVRWRVPARAPGAAARSAQRRNAANLCLASGELGQRPMHLRAPPRLKPWTPGVSGHQQFPVLLPEFAELG